MVYCLILISSEALNRILELTYFVWENSSLASISLAIRTLEILIFFLQEINPQGVMNYQLRMYALRFIFNLLCYTYPGNQEKYLLHFFPAVYNSITVLILPVCYLQIFVFVFSRYIKVESCLCKLSTWTSFQLSAWSNFFFRSDPHVCVELQIRTPQIRFMRRFPCIK